MKTALALITLALLQACLVEVPHAPDDKPVIPIAQIAPPQSMYDGGKAHYLKRVGEIALVAPIDGGVMLLGDSITEGWLWQEAPYDGPLINQGIGWDTTQGVLLRMSQISQSDPDIIFLLIGTNDIGYGRAADEIAAGVSSVVAALRKNEPKAQIYVQTLLPRSAPNAFDVTPINAQITQRINALRDTKVKLIDLYSPFAVDGGMNSALSDDGLHLNAAGYALWAQQIKPYLPQR